MISQMIIHQQQRQQQLEESNVGDIVTLYDGDVAIETHTITQADLDAGKVTITVSDENALSDGNHVLTTTVKDAAGNDESEKSTALEIDVDTSNDQFNGADLNDASDTGVSNTDNITSDNTPTVTIDLNDTSIS